MIKALLIGDLHGQFERLEDFLKLDPDIVIITGDISDFGPCEKINEIMSFIDVPCFAVPGNCDPCEMVEAIEYSDAVCIHGSTMKFGPLSLTGVGGSNPTPFGTPFELSEEEIEKLLARATAQLTQNVHNVLVCHAPPLGTLDRIGDANVGSESLRAHLHHFDLVCCGHIHEQRGVMNIDGIKVVNPGMASEGNCALIYFGDEPKKIEIELLTC